MWMVECCYSSGWGDAEWTQTEGPEAVIPLIFESEAAANDAIEEFVADCKLSEVEVDRAHYRAVVVSPTA